MRQLVINTQERAISTDVNRLQKFKEKDVAEMFRYWLDVVGSTDDLDSGVTTEPNTVETPLRAEIINGLLVKPQIGSTDVLIDPGVIMIMAPDAVADESNYKHVLDAGVAVLGTLTIAAGGGGATRIDVIECQINAVDEIVTDNRDIFNAVTGLFGVSTVTKERAKRLTYRVRQGTAGAGYPGSALGWLPLCIASVPNTSVNNDTVTFWDVRPLVSDRNYGGFNITENWPVVERANFILDDKTTGGQMRVSGQFRSRNGTGRRIGGIIRRGTPGTDADRVDIKDVANQASGYALAGTGFDYLYLLTPFGLPRWARYADAPSARLPRSPRGIPVLTTVAPNHLTGTPSAAVALPGSTGLVGTTSSGILLTPVRKSGGAMVGGLADGKRLLLADQVALASDGGANSTSATFTFTEGTTHPANAKVIYAQLAIVVDTASNKTVQTNDCNFLIVVPGLAGAGNRIARVQFSEMVAANTVGAPIANVTVFSATFAIPVPVQYPTTPGGTFKGIAQYTIAQVDGSGPGAFDSTTLNIVGYELAP